MLHATMSGIWEEGRQIYPTVLLLFIFLPSLESREYCTALECFHGFLEMLGS